MELGTKFVRRQLTLLKPFITGSSIETARKTQDATGELMAATRRKEVIFSQTVLRNCDALWVTPNEQLSRSCILYLHGGGYVCGDLSYAAGFGSILADSCKVPVFCPSYRLAPESKYPAALEDALDAYTYIIEYGYRPQQIILAGESAGGGLIYCLCLKLKELGLPLPAGIVAVSPWVDLTSSGQSYETNKDIDPSMTKELLQFFAGCYGGEPTDPLISPIFGELTGMPPSLLFVGGDEVMLDDTLTLHELLLKAGCDSRLTVAPEMWHGYVLYCLKERKEDLDKISEFVAEALGH